MVVKFELVISSLHFSVLFYLRHVNSIGTSNTEAMQSIIMQLLNQGGTAEKIIEKHVTIGISQVPHSNLNSIPFSPFAFGTILIDRRNLFHCHIYTNILTPTLLFVLYILSHSRSTFKLAHILVNTLKRTVRQAFSKYFI